MLLVGCATLDRGATDERVLLPLLRGWFDGDEVVYVTTDVSDPEVARAKDANYAPRLAYAATTQATRQPGQRSVADKVYSVVNASQGSVFASAPAPVGWMSISRSYSPLWQLVKVTWLDPNSARELHSEEEVLAAAEGALVTLEETSVVLNCPIVHRNGQGDLRGVSLRERGR